MTEDQPTASARAAHSWSYRILDFGTHLALHEVHFGNDRPVAFGAEPATFLADDDERPASIVRALQRALSDAEAEAPLKVADLWPDHVA